MIHRTEDIDAVTGSITVTEADTDAQTVTVTVDGGTPDVRPMTPEELEFYLASEEFQAGEGNQAQMVTESNESVDKLVAVIEALNAITDMTNASINANPAAVIKALTRECKTIARQANREARLTSGRIESTDTGPVTDV